MKIKLYTILTLLGIVQCTTEWPKLPLRSRDMPVEVIPSRYLTEGTPPMVMLEDSGILETQISVGKPSRGVPMLLDIAGKECDIPTIVTAQGDSMNLMITYRGTWRDEFLIGDLAVMQEFKYTDEPIGKLGLNVDNTNGPLFNNIVTEGLLGMQVFSCLLTRYHGVTVGELRIGELEKSLKGAQLRYNPVMLDELGWSLRIFDMRIGSEYLGYKGRAVVDFMTPFVILPRVIFTALAQLLGQNIVEENKVLLTKPISCKKLQKLPPIHFSIETDEYVWDAVHYTLKTKDDRCMLALAGHDTHKDGMPIWVFGTTFFLDRATVFDLEMAHIGLTDYEAEYNRPKEEFLMKEKEGL